MIPNGTFTIESPRGGHRTFNVRTVRRGKLAGKRIISILGPDADYVGFGFVADRGIALWTRHRTSGFYRGVCRMIEQLLDGAPRGLPLDGYEVRASKRCLRCNRELTTPESLDLGIGPECASKMITS